MFAKYQTEPTGRLADGAAGAGPLANRQWVLIRMELVKVHHKQDEACESRPRYRQGRFEKV